MDFLMIAIYLVIAMAVIMVAVPILRRQKRKLETQAGPSIGDDGPSDAEINMKAHQGKRAFDGSD
jgi:hypothetical protein